MAANRMHRENCNQSGNLKDGWSHWRRAMSSVELRGYEDRSEGQRGFKLNSMDVPNGTYCGIYEWRMVKDDTRPITVYVGSTCRGTPGALQRRILEYCKDGSHKEELINEALENGFDLEYGTKGSNRSKIRAENMENELLGLYDYPWNRRRNRDIREVWHR